MENLKAARIAAGMTQEQLGKLVHIQKSAISKYERGAIEPTQQVLIKLASILHVTTDYLLGLPENSVIKDDKKSEKTQELTNLFDTLSDENKAKVLEFTRLYIEHQNKK